MTEHTHREIVLGPRTWRHAQPSAWRWDVSAKGNATTKVGDVRLVVAQFTFPGRNNGKWTYSMLTTLEDGAKWERGNAFFDTEDEAKEHALRAAGMGSAVTRTPVAPNATEAARCLCDTAASTFDCPVHRRPTRRIVL